MERKPQHSDRVHTFTAFNTFAMKRYIFLQFLPQKHIWTLMKVTHPAKYRSVSITNGCKFKSFAAYDHVEGVLYESFVFNSVFDLIMFQTKITEMVSNNKKSLCSRK